MRKGKQKMKLENDRMKRRVDNIKEELQLMNAESARLHQLFEAHRMALAYIIAKEHEGSYRIGHEDLQEWASGLPPRSTLDIAQDGNTTIVKMVQATVDS